VGPSPKNFWKLGSLPENLGARRAIFSTLLAGFKVSFSLIEANHLAHLGALA